jgi:hypothetical protein
MRLGRPPFPAGSGQPARPAGGGEPPEEAAEAFERLLAAAPRDGEGQDDAPAGLPPGWHPGDALLRSLGSRPALPDDIAPGQDAARLLDEIAGRVLVAEAGGPPEVRVIVKDDVFPGLEVRLRPTPDGLMVELVAASAADVAVLRAEASRLVASLRERTGRKVELRIRRDGDPEAGAAHGEAAAGGGPAAGEPR